jgi:6-phosphogluconate dehydrogenase
MAGGDKKWINLAMPIFDALRPEGPRDEGFAHAGEVGAGHYAKMVHNGIEYGLMHAYAEGYELLEAKDLVTDVHACFKAWSSRHRGPVLAAGPPRQGAGGDPAPWRTSTSSPRTPARAAGPSDGGIDNAVPMPVLAASLFARFSSRQQESPAMQMVSACAASSVATQVAKKNEKVDVNHAAEPKADRATSAQKRRGQGEGNPADAGPSSGSGETPTGGGAADAGPTSGAGSRTN